jgi:hypothetical protein
MANDRLFLHCRSCGASVSLYKYYPTGLGSIPTQFQGRVAGGYCTRTGGEIGEWLDEHVMCEFRKGKHRDVHVLPDNCIALLNEKELAALREEEKPKDSS